MPNWLALIIVGFVLCALIYAPVFPAAWARFVQFIGGVLIVVGVILLVLILLGVTVTGVR